MNTPAKSSFDQRWKRIFGFPESDWMSVAEERLRDNPFVDAREAGHLLTQLFGRRKFDVRSPENAALAGAFGWCCFAMTQSGSAFPAHAENYAAFLLNELSRPPAKRRPESGAFAILLGQGVAADGRCGFNNLRLADIEAVRASERVLHSGELEVYLNAREKYDEFALALKASKGFAADWACVKPHIPKYRATEPILHRTLIPERNWRLDGGGRFCEANERFQALFDLFCWKYYLWGMQEDEPLLMKASVTFTPFGTQIFIPGYLSFDAKRDLNFKVISRLHRARGVIRQGQRVSSGRSESLKKSAEAKQWDLIARKQGLRGDARYEFILSKLSLLDSGDYRQLRRLLRRSA